MKTRHLPSILLACLFLLVSVSSFADDDDDNPQNTPETPVVTAYYQAPNAYVTVRSNGTTINETGVYYRKNSSAATDLSGTRFTSDFIVSDGNFCIDLLSKLGDEPGTYFFRAYAKYGTASHAYSDILTFTVYNDNGKKVALMGQPINHDELEFVVPIKGTPISKSLFLQIDNITSDATITITPKSGTSASTFIVTPDTITKEDLANGITITITFSGNVKTASATFNLAGTALDGLGHTTLNLKGSYIAIE